MSMETQKATFTLKGLGGDGGAAATGDCGKGETESVRKKKSKRKKRERTARRGDDRVSHHPVILSSRSPITSFFSCFQFLTLYLGMATGRIWDGHPYPIPVPNQNLRF